MIFILILILLLAGTNFYIAHRLHLGVTSFFPNAHFWIIMVFVVLLTLAVIMGFVRPIIGLPRSISYPLGVIGAYCMGIFLYLLLFTVAFDLILLIPRVMKLPFTNHRFFNGIVTAVVVISTCATCIYGAVNANRIKNVSYEIHIADKKDISDLNIVLISDIHLGAVGSEERLENIVNRINALNPDIVCIAGDIFDTDFTSVRDPESAMSTIQKIRSTYGVYACFGNHDGGKTYKHMEDFLVGAGIKLLSDEYTVIDDRLVLVGRMDSHPIGGYGNKQRAELSEFFTPTDSSLPVIVMDHNPANIDQYSSDTDVILCGHTHKGQVFPGSLITNAMYDADYGYYRKDEKSPHVVVTSGVGYWGLPMRVGTNCEIVSLKIYKKGKEKGYHSN